MNSKVKKLVGIGLFAAIIIALQYVFGPIKVGTTSINPVLVPVVVGAAVYGWQAGAILGLVSGFAILWLAPPTDFFAISVVGTVVTVLLKGAASGLIAGAVYHLLQRWNRFVAVLVAAILCPVVNTGLFIAGCYVFFYDAMIAGAAGQIFFVYLALMIGVNFLVELGINVVLSPVIVRLVKAAKKN